MKIDLTSPPASKEFLEELKEADRKKVKRLEMLLSLMEPTCILLTAFVVVSLCFGFVVFLVDHNWQEMYDKMLPQPLPSLIFFMGLFVILKVVWRFADWFKKRLEDEVFLVKEDNALLNEVGPDSSPEEFSRIIFLAKNDGVVDSFLKAVLQQNRYPNRLEEKAMSERYRGLQEDEDRLKLSKKANSELSEYLKGH